MKKIFFFITVAGLATIISCTKVSSLTTLTLPPITILAVSASPGMVWYSGTSTISWSTMNTDSVHVNGVKVNGNSFVTPSLTSPITYTVIAFGPGGPETRTISVNVWSQKMTLISNYGNWKNIYSVSYKQADSLNPALYNYFPIDSVNCKTFHYLTDELSYLGFHWGYKGQTIEGCGNTTATENSTWDWENNETQISYGIGPSINWNVDTLNTSLLRISQNRSDTTFPGIIFHYVLKFVHG